MKNRTFFITTLIQLFIGHKDYSKFLFVHPFSTTIGLSKAYMTEIFGFKYSRLRIQEFLIVYSIIHKRVNREISHTKRSQVLEEMCSLTGIYPIVSKSGLHNDTRGRNMWPLHRNTQPCIAASPTSRTDST